MSQVNLDTTSSVTNVDSSMSLQFLYAKIQLMQSSLAKSKCEGLMKSLEDSQAEQKECAEMIEKARNLQQQAKNGTGDCSWDKNASVMPDEMVKYFKEHGISYDTKGGDNVHNKDEWEYNIKSLTNYQDTLGTDTQTKMVYLQQYMSEYNNYLSGASTQINNGSDTMKTILRNS